MVFKKRGRKLNCQMVFKRKGRKLNCQIANTEELTYL
jgi:hypothetical protein